jgi:hypothetical protein
MSTPDPIQLEPVTGPFVPASDNRRRVPEPPPVRLIAVDDVRLEATAGLEAELDAFYVGLLKLERETAADGVNVVRYKAENVRLRIVIVERRVEREDMRVLGIQVPVLLTIEHGLVESEREYVRQIGLAPGQVSLLTRDPAGNWVEISESRSVA